MILRGFDMVKIENWKRNYNLKKEIQMLKPWLQTTAL